jgi:hypothetical protein
MSQVRGVGNGATITGVFDKKKKISVTLKVAAI